MLLNCAVSRDARFDRKNYFYPDVPKNYQITQYAQPSTINGYVDFATNSFAAAIQVPTGSYLIYTFSNLNPSLRYTLARQGP